VRTRIYLRQRADGSWDDSPEAPFADVSHDEHMTTEALEAYRRIALLAIEHPVVSPAKGQR
jgi:hypothetical protein